MTRLMKIKLFYVQLRLIKTILNMILYFYNVSIFLICYQNNMLQLFWYTVKPVLSGHSKRRPKFSFSTDLQIID